MPSARYRADPPASRRTVPLDGLTLLFHRPSGTTHVVASPVPELLELLSAGDGTADELLARLAAEFDLDAEGAARDVIAARLAEMEASGLVFRA